MFKFDKDDLMIALGMATVEVLRFANEFVPIAEEKLSKPEEGTEEFDVSAYEVESRPVMETKLKMLELLQQSEEALTEDEKEKEYV